MKLASLEELAVKWTLAHTIALAAWVIVVVLGIFLLIKNTASTYPATDRLKTYAAENATFKYPANWTVNDCSQDKPFIELPGTIKSGYKDKDYQLKIYGAVAFNCVADRPERLDIYSENIEASESPCAPASSTEGERLGNGLYLQVQVMQDQVYAVHVKQNSCYAPDDTVVIGFAFLDPKAEPGDQAEFGAPWVKQGAFLKSRQYRDIKALAESIRY